MLALVGGCSWWQTLEVLDSPLVSSSSMGRLVVTAVEGPAVTAWGLSRG